MKLTRCDRCKIETTRSYSILMEWDLCKKCWDVFYAMAKKFISA